MPPGNPKTELPDHPPAAATKQPSAGTIFARAQICPTFVMRSPSNSAAKITLLATTKMPKIYTLPFTLPTPGGAKDYNAPLNPTITATTETSVAEIINTPSAPSADTPSIKTAVTQEGGAVPVQTLVQTDDKEQVLRVPRTFRHFKANRVASFMCVLMLLCTPVFIFPVMAIVSGSRVEKYGGRANKNRAGPNKNRPGPNKNGPGPNKSRPGPNKNRA